MFIIEQGIFISYDYRTIVYPVIAETGLALTENGQGQYSKETGDWSFKVSFMDSSKSLLLAYDSKKEASVARDYYISKLENK